MPDIGIDQQYLERLERLTLRWQKSFPGLVGGHNSSRFPGAGQEFLDHRQFHPGDDLRSINWRIYMRLERLVLKLFQIEPRVPVRLLLDTSASMLTGSPDKLHYGLRLAGALTYIGLVRLETICLQPFSDKMHEAMIASGGRHRFRKVVEYLNGIQGQGQSDFMQTARQFVAAYPQRGLVIVLSDFLDERDVVQPLQLLGEMGHEVQLIQLTCADDRDPDLLGEVELEDAETGRQMKLQIDEAARATYRENFAQHLQQVRSAAFRQNGRYALIDTSDSLDQVLFGNQLSAIGGVA